MKAIAISRRFQKRKGYTRWFTNSQTVEIVSGQKLSRLNRKKIVRRFRSGQTSLKGNYIHQPEEVHARDEGHSERESNYSLTHEQLFRNHRVSSEFRLPDHPDHDQREADEEGT